MSKETCDAVCRCVRAGGCSTISGLALRQEQYNSAVDFLAKRSLRGQVVDSHTRPRDLLPAGFDYSGLTLDAADVDPLADAQAASDARWGKGPLVPKTERAKLWAAGIDPDDHYLALLRRVGGR